MTTTRDKNIVAVELLTNEVMYENDRYAVYEAIFPATTEADDEVVYLDGYCIWNKQTSKSDGEFRSYIDARITATRWRDALDDLDLEEAGKVTTVPGRSAVHQH